MRSIYLNQDDSAFTRGHPLKDMTAEGAARLVDYYAQGGQLAGLAFCVNMQRALFDSKVWETLLDAYEVGSDGADSSVKMTGEAQGMAELMRNGVDHFKIWVQRARHHGIEAFLSMRMNDAHGLEGHGDFWDGHRKRAEDQGHFLLHATKFWKSNPGLRRAPYRYERSFEGAFDYGLEAVRRHHLTFIAEIFERYDMDGFEMDWMRWLFMFAPGGEAKGRDILSNFIEEVGQLRKAAELRWGHPIQLRHRIPAEPQTCYLLGYDVAAWAERGLADQIILSTFGSVTDFDYPIHLWRRLVGSNVKILALAEGSLMAYPGSVAHSYHFLLGAASSALQRGADGIYLFNECYCECDEEPVRSLFSELLNTMGDHKTLSRMARRHAVTFAQVRAPGEGVRALLPIPLINPSIGSDPGRWAENITLRISVGQKLDHARYFLCLGFSKQTPVGELEEMTVRINTVPVTPTTKPAYRDVMKEVYAHRDFVKETPVAAVHLFYYEADVASVQDDVNVVEFEPPLIEGRLEWAEILVLPE